MEIGAYTAKDIPFEVGTGRVTIAFEEPILEDGKITDGLIDVVVLAKGIKPNSNYEISLGGDNKKKLLLDLKKMSSYDSDLWLGKLYFNLMNKENCMFQ